MKTPPKRLPKAINAKYSKTPWDRKTCRILTVHLRGDRWQGAYVQSLTSFFLLPAPLRSLFGTTCLFYLFARPYRGTVSHFWKLPHFSSLGCEWSIGLQYSCCAVLATHTNAQMRSKSCAPAGIEPATIMWVVTSWANCWRTTKGCSQGALDSNQPRIARGAALRWVHNRLPSAPHPQVFTFKKALDGLRENRVLIEN